MKNRKYLATDIATVCTLLLMVGVYVTFRYVFSVRGESGAVFYILRMLTRVLLWGLTLLAVIGDPNDWKKRKGFVLVKALITAAVVLLLPNIWVVKKGTDAALVPVYFFLIKSMKWAIPLAVITLMNHFIRLPASKTDA